MGFSGSALDGESSAFSPPCPRMFLLILNPTRRHFEEADFLAKKMTSACLVWSFFFFFYLFKAFFSLFCLLGERHQWGLSPVALASPPGCVCGANSPILGDICRFLTRKFYF